MNQDIKDTVLIIIICTLTILLIIIGIFFYIINAKKVMRFIDKFRITVSYIILISLSFINSYLVTDIKQDKLVNVIKEISYINIVIWTLFVIESILKNPYMQDYLLFCIAYNEIVILCSYCKKFELRKFLLSSNPTKAIDSISSFLSLLLIVFIISWLVYYFVVRTAKKTITTIDEIEFKIVFLKSGLQSLTTSIALIGLAGWGLTVDQFLFALYVDAFAAFSYPILDMNKYIREKEIEQMNDRKHKTAIYFRK